MVRVETEREERMERRAWCGAEGEGEPVEGQGGRVYRRGCRCGEVESNARDGAGLGNRATSSNHASFPWPRLFPLPLQRQRRCYCCYCGTRQAVWASASACHPRGTARSTTVYLLPGRVGRRNTCVNRDAGCSQRTIGAPVVACARRRE